MDQIFMRNVQRKEKERKRKTVPDVYRLDILDKYIDVTSSNYRNRSEKIEKEKCIKQ